LVTLNEKVIFKSNRQMYEPLIIPGTQIGWLVQEWGVHTLNSRPHHPYLECQSSYSIPHNLAIKGTSGTATNHSHQGN